MNNGPERMQQGADPGVDAALEEALRQTLAPRTPSPTFTDRVMERALAGEQPAPLSVDASGRQAKPLRLLPLPHPPAWRHWVIGGAVAAALVAGVLEGGVALQRAHEQQQRIRAATADFQTTERITVHALAQARAQLQRAGVPLDVD